MRRMGITGKIWSSVAVFAGGALIAIVANQLQATMGERGLVRASEALFPAAQYGQQADAAFQRMSKGFHDAVLVEDASVLDQAAKDGADAADALAAAATLPGLATDRGAALTALAGSVRTIAGEAKTTYGAMITAGANLTPQVMEASRALAPRMEGLQKQLATTRETLAADLRGDIASMLTTSIQQRRISLGVFALTLLVSSVVVTRTIRGAVVRPIRSVAAQLERSASEVTSAAASVAELGAVALERRDRTGGLARGDVRLDGGNGVDDAPERRQHASEPRPGWREAETVRRLTPTAPSATWWRR